MFKQQIANKDALINLHTKNLNKEKIDTKKNKGKLKQATAELDKSRDNAIYMARENACEAVEESKKSR